VSWLADLRLGVRQLRRSPGYTAAAVLTLAAAIGANSAIFSVVRAVLLRPMPIAAPDNLVVCWQVESGAGQGVVELTYRHLREWTAAGAPFIQSSLVATHLWNAVLTHGGQRTRLEFAGVSAGFFDTLGVAPILGRALRADDDVPNGPAVAVISHAMWVRRFASDPDIVGKSINLSGQPTEILGVMPAGLDFPRGAEYWIPSVPVLASGAAENVRRLDNVGVFYVLGRVRAGMTADAVRGRLDQIEAQLDQSTPGRLEWGDHAVVASLAEHVFGPVRPALWLLWASVVVLLLIACANLSGLLLTRVARARREDGVRLALGASRATIARLWLTEILLVAVIGGTIGLALAQALLRAVVALAAADVPRLDSVSIDLVVALFSFGVVLTSALLAGLVPMRAAGRIGIAGALGDSERTTAARGSLNARSVLLSVQIALAVVLLVAAGLIVRSFVNLQRTDLGFVPDRVLSLQVDTENTAEPQRAWMQRYLERARALPDVESAGAVFLRPLMLGPIGQGVRVLLEGQSPDDRRTIDANPTLNYQTATPGYFETMRIRLVRGRVFDERDTADGPRVAIVSESTARRLWPGQDAIGRRVRMSTFSAGEPRVAWREIVGVVGDVRYRGIDEAQLDIYDPAMQVGLDTDNVVVRTTGSPLAAAGALQALALELDADAIVDDITPMDAIVRRAQAPWRLSLWMFLLFAGLAFGLAAVGLFSLVALDVAHRRREFAVRLALGAKGGTIVGSVLRRAGVSVAVGIVTGLAAAWFGTRLMQSLLVGVRPNDRMTYVAVLAAVAVIVGISAYIPARRAALVEPQVLFRGQ
jgi:predicted permease